MPGTEYPPDIELNNEFLSVCVSKLLVHLEGTGEWTPPPAPEPPYQDDLTLEWIVPPSVPKPAPTLPIRATATAPFAAARTSCI